MEQGNYADIRYVEVEDKLRKLLQEFGPTRQAVHPRIRTLPVCRTTVCGPLDSPPELRNRLCGEPLVSDLKALDIACGFSADVKAAFRADCTLVNEIAARVLEQHFPESLHEDILDEVGMSLETRSKSARRRDPRFRDRVLVAYGYQCAIVVLT